MKRILFAIAALAVLSAISSCKKDNANKEIVATAIELSTNELTLVKGGNEVLTVTYIPDNTTKRDITWVSSNTSIATVADGIVVGIDPGITEIIAKCGEAIDKCKVTVVSGVPAGAVDLGIVMTREDGTTYKLYWAKSNLSSSGLCANPEDYGDSFAWGETAPKSDCSWSTYNWGKHPSSLTKYNTNSSNGTVDNITELQRGEKEGETQDDAARAILGGKWRMPTDAEWTALHEQCSWNWTSNYNGTDVAGRIVTSNKNGNSIFLPVAGDREGNSLSEVGSHGCYWSSSLNTGSPYYAYYMYFSSENVRSSSIYRCYGLSVRPVSE